MQIYIPRPAVPKCVRTFFADFVLVLDTSSSMSGAKLAAAREASKTFVDLLDLAGGDAAAVVWFNRSAGIQQPLTHSLPALRSAINNVPEHPGTRIDLGLDAATTVVTGPGFNPTKVVILLTDGRPTLSDEQTVMRSADRLHATGATVYSIGLGDDVNPGLLVYIAGSPSRYYFAPGPGDLNQIYQEIIGTLCGVPTPSTTPPTPTPTPVQIYIPRPAVPKCTRTSFADVVLVLDSSSSMKGAKFAAAKRAVKSFVDLLDLPGGDAAAVVWFNSTARIIQPLSRDRAALHGAIDRVPEARGTRIDLGLLRAADALAAPSANATRLVLLLTDGIPSGGDARAAADVVKSRGVALYAIGLGADVDLALLVDLAGTPARTFFAPGPEDLEKIYQSIAQNLCATPVPRP
jgi:Mg-chelatase subunit ChlD